MGDRFLVLSDIHGNLSALRAVISDFKSRGYNPDGIIILGDNINYGMRPNEVVEELRLLSERYDVIVNIFGNHEKALIDGETSHFSTDRGKKVLDFTRNHLNGESFEYINTLTKEGFKDLVIDGKRILFIHGDLSDPYWGKLNKNTVDDKSYGDFDFVISGHSHIPHLMEHFHAAENPLYRNKKRTVFINPGSVGQPRNHNPSAQYLYMEISSETFHFNSVPYDIDKERALYTEEVDPFYSDRLTKGI